MQIRGLNSAPAPDIGLTLGRLLWLLRTGLLIYDHLGGRRRLPPTRALDLSRDPAGKPLKPSYRRAFEYSDC